MFQWKKECPELWAQNGTDDSSTCPAPWNSHREVTVFLKEVLSRLPEQHEENSESAQGTASPLLPPRPARSMPACWDTDTLVLRSYPDCLLLVNTQKMH